MENKQEKVQILFDAIEEFGLIIVLNKTLVKNFNVRLPFSQAACDVKIEEAEFSVRANNCLKRVGINTISELIDAVQGDKLLMIRNLGRKSLNEIKTRLLNVGYTYLTEKGKKEFLSDLIDRNSSLMKIDGIK